MAYSKQTWDASSYVNPTRMNHIEDGISASVEKSDITNRTITGSTAPFTIPNNRFFYLNGVLVRSIITIQSGETFTENTNYIVPSAGSLNYMSDEINNLIGSVNVLSKSSSSGSSTLTFTVGGKSCGLIFISRTATTSAVYAFHATNSNGDFEFTKLAGGTVNITCTDTNKINVTVPSYSTVTVMSNLGAVS